MNRSNSRRKFQRFTSFQWLTLLLFSGYMGTLVIVTILAYGRPSGVTGMKMADVQQIRYQAKQQSPSP